ncbi:MAG TPA: hypothetical protein PKJ85_12175 [Nitrosomonas nitrosa]|nr:hypothetical protein [Nitrosomonas nitrosa]
MHASSSTEQQHVEAVILAALNDELALALAPTRLALNGKASVQLDGVDERNRVACEIYARLGRLKGSQPDKVASDLLKLNLVEQVRGGTWRKILCFASSEAAKVVQGKSWLAAATAHFRVEVRVVPLPEAERQLLLAAQARQVMVNK